MGEVYLAEDTRLKRLVAIKTLVVDSNADEHASRRLMREAQAAAALDHPNICSIYELGEQDGRAFIVMQYVEGEDAISMVPTLFGWCDLVWWPTDRPEQDLHHNGPIRAHVPGDWR